MKARVQAGEAVIEVMDSGPGVPPEERSIFSFFFRGRGKGEGTRIKGSGLGLAIARELVEAHGGHIAVVPEEAAVISVSHFRAVRRVRLPTPRNDRQQELHEFVSGEGAKMGNDKFQGSADRRRQGFAAADCDAADGGGYAVTAVESGRRRWRRCRCRGRRWW